MTTSSLPTLECRPIGIRHKVCLAQCYSHSTEHWTWCVLGVTNISMNIYMKEPYISNQLLMDASQFEKSLMLICRHGNAFLIMFNTLIIFSSHSQYGLISAWILIFLFICHFQSLAQG